MDFVKVDQHTFCLRMERLLEIKVSNEGKNVICIIRSSCNFSSVICLFCSTLLYSLEIDKLRVIMVRWILKVVNCKTLSDNFCVHDHIVQWNVFQTVFVVICRCALLTFSLSG